MAKKVKRWEASLVGGPVFDRWAYYDIVFPIDAQNQRELNEKIERIKKALPDEAIWVHAAYSPGGRRR